MLFCGMKKFTNFHFVMQPCVVAREFTLNLENRNSKFILCLCQYIIKSSI